MLVEKLQRIFPVKVYAIEAVIFFFFRERKNGSWIAVSLKKRLSLSFGRKQLCELFCRLALREQGVCGPISSFLLK
jgi:hypothetical protein